VKVADMRALSTRELEKELETAHQELFNLRFRLATMQLRNHREVRQVRRKIGRINTILSEKNYVQV